MNPSVICPVILSGGSGTRLWPLSRADRPKQFLPLDGGFSLLQQTALRVADRARFAAPVVVANARHLEEIERQLGAVGIAPGRLILEPRPRNTAAAIALAAFSAAPDDLLLVMPSDHRIADLAAFHQAIDRGVAAARDGWLVTFGLSPDRPETGYGYIERGESIAGGAFKAAAFVEKPDRAAAELLLERGGHLWNGGIFLFRARNFLDSLERAEPAVFERVGAAIAGTRSARGIVRPDPACFEAAPAISVDHAVMERSPNVAVVPADMGWSDVGSWDSLNELAGADDQGNRLEGEIVAMETKGCSIRSTGPLVAALGIQNLTIVATPDAVLIIPTGRGQDVARIVREIEARRAGASQAAPETPPAS
jgi:mannose-1-phosphate guanylyltransferase/mannose-1-phosphate guanylyltransferase/mannose-6-phosphate isomerase